MRDVVADSLIGAVVVAAVIFSFALARRFVPAPAPPKEFANLPLEELDARFASTNFAVYAAMIFVGIAVAWGLHYSLVNGSRAFAASDGPYALALYPQTAIWWFLPGFAAIAFSWDITLAIWSLLRGKQEVALFEYWTSAKIGFDSTKLLNVIGIVVVVPIAVLTALALPEHSLLRDDDILSRGYGVGKPQTFRYADARQLSVIQGYRDRDGNLRIEAAAVLDFADGRRWTSDIGDFQRAVDPKLLDILERKTGLAPEYFPTAKDIRSIAR